MGAIFLSLWLGVGGTSAQSCTRYLNATEGDDGNSGDARAHALKSFELAFLTFPSGSVVCMTAGEYIFGDDANGIQLSGIGARNKDMRFVLEGFGGETTVRFTEDEFHVDIGAGTLTFQSGSTDLLKFGEGDFNNPTRYPGNTNFLHTLALVSGKVNADDVDLEIGNSVGNPLYVHPTSGKSAPDAAIVRGTGTIHATDHFTSVPRVVRYIGSGSRASGNEIPPTLLGLEFEHLDGQIELSNPISFVFGAIIESKSSGSALISIPISMASAGQPSIMNLNGGSLEFGEAVFLEIPSDKLEIVQNTGSGSLLFNQLRIAPSGAVASNISATLANSGSGTLDLRQLDSLPNVSGHSASIVVENQDSGTVQLGRPTTRTTLDVGLRNLGTGSVRIVGETLVGGIFVNRGSVVLDGRIELAGNLENTGAVRLLSDVVIAGQLVNAGTIDVGAHTFTFVSEGPHSNSGSILTSIAGGAVRLKSSARIVGDGTLPTIIADGGSPSVSASVIAGDISSEAGSLLALVRADYVEGDVITAGGDVQLPTVSIGGNLRIEDGGIVFGGDVQVHSDFRELSTGTVELSGYELLLSGDFDRSGGSFQSSGGAVVFRGTNIQTFRAGPDLVLHELRIENTRVALSQYSVSLAQRLVVSEGSGFLLSDFEIILIGPAGSVINDGEISSSITGHIRFAGPAGSTQQLSGGGLYGNIAVELEDESDDVLIAGEDVRQSGILSLTRGAISVAEGSALILTSDNGKPLVRRNLGDSNVDGAPDGKGINANSPGRGQLETPSTGYNLEYFGTIGGRSGPGAEFPSRGIVDLRIAIEGRGNVPAVLELASDLSFSGNLELLEGATLGLGTYDLTATGNGIHSVLGRIDASDGAFVVEGSGRVHGGDLSQESSIQNLTITTSGFVEIADVRLPGRFEVLSGRTTLEVPSDGDPGLHAASNVGSLVLRGGQIELQSSIEIVDSLIATGGRMVANGNDVIMAESAALRINQPAIIDGNGTGAVIWLGSGSIETGTAEIPRLVMSAGAEGRVTLAGPTRVSQSLVHLSGTLDLRTFNLIHEGRLWEFHGGGYSGDGRAILVGSVAVELFEDLILPGLQIDGSSGQSVTTIRSGNDSLSTLVVQGDFDLIEGSLDLGRHDLLVHGGVFSYHDGSITGTTSTNLDSKSTGELVFSNAEIDLAGEFALPNVRVLSNSRVHPESAPLRISRRIAFEAGTLDFAESEHVIIDSGARIVRSGSGNFNRRPELQGSVSLIYYAPEDPVAGGVIETGFEVPENAVASVIVDAGSNLVELRSSIRVRDHLQILSGALSAGAHQLLIEPGAIVQLDFSGGVAPRFETKGYTTSGPISLVFSGSAGDLVGTDLSFPTDAMIEKLIVRMENEHTFALHANSRAEGVVIQSSEGAGLDLNGKRLFVQGNLVVNSGLLSSEQQALLQVEGDLITSQTSLVSGVISATVQGDSEIGGRFEAYLLRTFGDIFVSGSLGGRTMVPDADAEFFVSNVPNIRFLGRSQLLRFSNADNDPLTLDDAINYLTIALQDSAGTVRIESAGGSHTLGVNRLLLERGILVTGDNDIRLPNNGPGYVRDENARSHVAGRISRQILAGQPNPFKQPYGRLEFPLGSETASAVYRPLSITFSLENPSSISSVLTVASVDKTPGGYLGLPIDLGQNVLLDDVSGFHWIMNASPAIPVGQRLTIGVVAADFSAFTAARNLRLLRRSGGNPAQNPWHLQGTSNEYDNALVNIDGTSAPFIQVIQTTWGIPSSPEIIAVGIEKEAIPFARVQLMHLLPDVGPVSIVSGDSILTEGLGFADATAFVRLPAGGHDIAFTAGENDAVVSNSIEVEAGRDYLAVAVPIKARPELILAGGAHATPELSARSDASLAFYNGIPETGPLSLRSRDSESILLKDVPFGQLSDSYIPLEPADNGFDLLESSSIIASMRADLTDRAGMTVVAVAYKERNLLLIDNHGHVASSHIQVAVDETLELPETFAVRGNYPNPFNPTTSILIDLPEAADVMVEVYDLIGRRLMTLDAGAMLGGSLRTVPIDASSLASGIYLYEVRAHSAAGMHTGYGKMTLIR